MGKRESHARKRAHRNGHRDVAETLDPQPDTHELQWMDVARTTHAKLEKLNELKRFVEDLGAEDAHEKEWVLAEIDKAMCRLVLDCASRVR